MPDGSNLQLVSLRNRVSPEEWQMRVDLAAAYRLTALYGMSELEDRSIDWDVFDAEGWSIAREVKATLPDWTVIYFDEVRLRRGERSCEVEIIWSGNRETSATRQ